CISAASGTRIRCSQPRLRGCSRPGRERAEMPHQIPVERDSKRCDGANMRRRDLLALMGIAAGSAAMYRAMTSLSVAAESTYAGPIRLDGDPKGTSIIILGAGLRSEEHTSELQSPYE